MSESNDKHDDFLSQFEGTSSDTEADRDDGIPVVGGKREPDYLHSYHRAAAELIRSADAKSGTLEEFAMPILYLQRHSVELALKRLLQSLVEIQVIRRSLRLIDEHPEWNESAAADPLGSHSITGLLDTLRVALKDQSMQLPEVFENTVALINKIENENPMLARYRTSRDGERHLPDELEVDISAIQRRLDGMLQHFPAPLDFEQEFDGDALETQLYYAWKRHVQSSNRAIELERKRHKVAENFLQWREEEDNVLDADDLVEGLQLFSDWYFELTQMVPHNQLQRELDKNAPDATDIAEKVRSFLPEKDVSECDYDQSDLKSLAIAIKIMTGQVRQYERRRAEARI